MKNYSYFLTGLTLITIVTVITLSCDRGKNNSSNFSHEQISSGETLVLEGKCNFCHTPEVATDDKNYGKILYGHPAQEKIPEIPGVPVGSQQWMEFVTNLGSTVWIAGNTIVFSANITPDKKTGIGKWSESDFINTIRTGRHPGWKRELNKPMPWLDYAKLTNEQLSAIYAYLMSQQPVKNKVPEPVKFN
jgi:hypothetical protein